MTRSEFISSISAVAAVAAAALSWHFSTQERSSRLEEISLQKAALDFQNREIDFKIRDYSMKVLGAFINTNKKGISEELCFQLFNNLQGSAKERIIRKFFGSSAEFREQGTYEFPPQSSADLNLCISGENPDYVMNAEQALGVREAIILKLNSFETAFSTIGWRIVEPEIVCPTLYNSFVGQPSYFLSYVDSMKNPPALFLQVSHGKTVVSFETTRKFLKDPADCTGWIN